ncbi:hypothetical protein KJR25_09245 [Pediococcus acidilactici]|uniref:hypothetical protein n=1 Tax=Pediococcus acidilactici TaxID=1254 RepID=UPI001F1A5277|nr:hypothetical protein [Pediococcus acidilactici]MCE5962957.1 hypothetical protein [Pediococcus acidilactici]
MALDPILTSNKKSTLDDKKVKFSNGNDFSMPDFHISDTDKSANKESNKDKTHKKKRTQSQRRSETTVLKCRTLEPFLTEVERADKASIDDIISTLADYYINQGLPDRQKDVFEGMYDINIKRLK